MNGLFQVYNISQNVQEDDLQHLQVTLSNVNTNTWLQTQTIKVQICTDGSVKTVTVTVNVKQLSPLILLYPSYFSFSLNMAD